MKESGSGWGASVARCFILAGTIAVLTTACAYDPPVRGDRLSPRYQADLAECRTVADKAAHHAVISRGLLFMTYPISLAWKRRSETRKCMIAKGYELASRQAATSVMAERAWDYRKAQSPLGSSGRG